MSRINEIDREIVNIIRKQYSLRPDIAQNILNTIKKEYSQRYLQNRTVESRESNLNYMTGILSIDIAGGLPYGIVQIFGQPSTYKSALVIDIISRNGRGLYINADNKHEEFPDISENSIIIMDNTHKTSKAIKDMVKVGLLSDFIVIDSIAALDRAFDTLKTIKKLSTAISDLKVIFTNQMRNYGLTGSDEPFGPQPIHSLCSDIFRVKQVDQKGSGTNVTYSSILHNKSFVVSYNRNAKVSNNLTIISLLTQKNIIRRTGTSYAYKDRRYKISELVIPSEDNKLLEIIDDIDLSSLEIPSHIEIRQYVDRQHTYTTI